MPSLQGVHAPRQHARERRANARRVVTRSRLQSLSGSRRERLSRRPTGAFVRPEAAVRALWALRCRCTAELARSHVVPCHHI